MTFEEKLRINSVMHIVIHQGDLRADVSFDTSVAVDTETLGLNIKRDALCLVQLSAGDGVCHLVKFDTSKPYNAPRLKKLLEDAKVKKIFHYARFDVAVLKHYLGAETNSVYCTKIASKLTRTFTDRHGLKDLCLSILNIELCKEVRTSDWSAPTLTEEQKKYAASDVLYLHQIKDALDEMLHKTDRTSLAESCFNFLPTIVNLDLMGWDAPCIFAHK